MNNPEAYTKYWTIDERLTGSLSALTNKNFAIVNEAEGKAFYCSYGQDMGYDDCKNAFDVSNEGYLFKIGRITGGRSLRLVTPDEEVYEIAGGVGYLNSQDVTGDCCFIQELNGQRGYDIPDGAVWDIQYVDGKGWSLRNVGTGKYLKDASPAKYDDPTYFTFCTLAPATSGISELTEEPVARRQSDEYVYNLQGVRVAKKSNWNSLPRGIYIVNGRKVTR